MKLVIFSDIHYGPAEIGVNYKGVKRKLTQYAEPLLNGLIKQINEIKPDIVVNCGDLIEDLNDKELDIINLKYIWNVLKKIKAPFYSVNGNHDLRAIGRDKVAEIMGYNTPTFSVDLNGYHLVFLGLSFEHEISDESGGIVRTRTLREDDIDWLKKDIKENKLPSIVFLHFGLAEDDMKGNWWFERNPEHALLQNRNDVKAVLKTDKNLLAVFSGHQHWTKTIIEDKIPYHIIGSLVEDINSDGKPEGIWFEVDIKGKQLNIKKHYYDFKV